ncbi:hypothetical protein P355_4483 [Burkholderia cenocepacia KC-01]|nr:hypothetical protein P355_4483 [Burkholderia cenocepacia KC-01]
MVLEIGVEHGVSDSVLMMLVGHVVPEEGAGRARRSVARLVARPVRGARRP